MRKIIIKNMSKLSECAAVECVAKVIEAEAKKKKKYDLFEVNYIGHIIKISSTQNIQSTTYTVWQSGQKH